MDAKPQRDGKQTVARVNADNAHHHAKQKV